MIAQSQIPLRRWAYLAFGTLALLFAGFIYAWSILKSPFAEEFGWNPTQLALNHTLTMVFVAVGNLSAGVLAGKVPSRILLLCSGIMVSLGLFLTSQISGRHVVALYLSFAFLCGAGIGAYLVTLMSVVGSWFPDLGGLCSGTMQFGFGLSALILGSLAGYLMDLQGFGWRSMFQLFSIVIGIVLVAVALFVQSPDHTVASLLQRVLLETKTNACGPVLELPPSGIVRRKGFWYFYLFCLMINGIGTTIVSFAADFFLFIGAPPYFAVSMVGLVSFSNGLGRFLLGVVFDRVGRRSVMSITAVISIAAPILLLLSLPGNSTYLAAVGACLAGASFGCIPSSAGPIVRSSYGDANFAANYSIVLTSSMPSSFVATVAGRIITNGGTYFSVFVILLTMSFAALAFCMLMKQP